VNPAGNRTASRGSLLLLFAVLAAIHTWPLLPQAASHALDDSDAILNGWLLAALARAIASHPLTFFDINAYYPFQHALATLDHQLSAVVFTGPVYLVSGNAQLALNLYTFATFVLGGVFCAILAEELTGSIEAGVVAGSLFAFSSGRMENLNHSHVLGNFWLPLALLLMHRYLRAPSWRALAAAVGAALLLALTAWYNAALGPLALAIVVAAAVARRGVQAAGAIGRLAVGAAVAGVIVAAIALPYVRVVREFRSPPLHVWDPAGATAQEGSDHRAIPASVIQDNSTGLEAFGGVRGGTSAPWLGPLRNVGLVGGRFFPGMAGAALAVIAIVLLVRAQARASWLAWPALALAAIFTVAALSLATHRLPGWPLALSRSYGFFALLVLSFVAWIALPMPAAERHSWLEHARTYFVVALVGGALSLGVAVYLSGTPIARGIYPANAPGFELLRAPVRFGALVALGAAVLAACGYAAVTRTLQGHARTAVAVCAVLLVNVELFAPMPRMRRLPRVPDVYEWLRRAPEGPVVEFPAHANLWSLHWSLVHRQPLAGGYGLVEPPTYARLRDDDELSPAMVEHIRANLHARYIVIDRTRYSGEKDAGLAANLARNEGTLKKVAAADGREVYEIGGPSRGTAVLRAYLPWMIARARGVSVEATLDSVRAGVPHVVQVWGNGKLLVSAPYQPGAPAPRLFAPLPPDREDGVNVEVLGDYAAAPAEISIEAGPRATRLQIDGHLWIGRIGYTLAVIRPDGRVEEVRTFNTSWHESASHDLAARIAAIPQGWTAALATNYDASRALTADAVDALKTLGMAADLRGRFRVMHAAIGTKEAAPATALEHVSPDAARCAIGQPVLVPVSVRDVRLY
jgi:Interleukin-like EMT inducer